MPKSIAELPKQREEFGKAYRANKEKPVKDEPSVVVEDDEMADLKEMSESKPESKKKNAKEDAFEFTEGLKEMFKKPVEKPSGMARLFGSAQGMARKIGDYFDQAKKWAEQQFAKKELAKGKTKENIFESIDQNEDIIDLTAFEEVVEGTSEAVDLDVADFEGRSEGGLENLEEKAVEAEVEEDIVKETFRSLEGLEREAEEAKAEFKEEMSDEEYESRAKEARDVLGLNAPSPEELKQKTGKKAGGYRIPSPEEVEETAVKAKRQKFRESGYKVPSPEEVELEGKEKDKYTPPTPKKLEEKIAKQKQQEQLDIIKDQLGNLRKEQAEFKKRAEEVRKKKGEYGPDTYKQNEMLLKEIIKLEKQEKSLEKELKEFEKKFGAEDFSDEEKKWFKKGEDMGRENDEDGEIEKEGWKDEEKEFFKKGEKGEKRAKKAEKTVKAEKGEGGEAPFSKKAIDDDHEKYLEIMEYKEEHDGEAPKGESEDLHLSFSYNDYVSALKKNPKQASEMEEEMYEKLSAHDGRRNTVGRGPVTVHRALSRK